MPQYHHEIKRKSEKLLTSDIILRYFTGIQRVIIFTY